MKQIYSNKIKTFFIAIALISATVVNAQGIYVNKTDGTRVVFMNADIESIVAFDKEEGNNNFQIDGHDAVDLGLSVKWATCNVGANKPEEYGGFYSWGETETKDDYFIESCKWYSYSLSSLQSQGVTDYSNNLNPQYDVASQKWGNRWRIPTKEEFEELKSKCSFTWTELGGVNGLSIVGPNGNSIFLPAAGNYFGNSYNNEGASGFYWSSSADQGYFERSKYAFYFHFTDGGGINIDEAFRDGGYQIRPVTQ